MDRSEVEEFVKYYMEMDFLGKAQRDIKELTRYAKSKGVAKSTCSRHITDISENKVKLITHIDGMAAVNKEQVEKLIEYLNGFLGKSDAFVGPCITGESVISVKTSNQELLNKIGSLEKRLKTAKSKNDKMAKENEELKAQLKKQGEDAEKEIKNLKQTIAALKIMKPILVLDSEKVVPCESETENMLVEACEDEKKYGVMDAVMDGVMDNAMDTVTDDKKSMRVLNEKNYLIRKIQKIFSEKFLKKKVERVLEKGDKPEFVSDKVYVNNLLSADYYTNQEKLALYAAFSDYRHTDFEKLLNFAGDCNIDADMTIKWAESLNDKVDYMQIKNALRQLAKPTEFKMKYELARELLLGVWEVEFNVNKVPTKFKLVSEKDLNIIREALELPSNAFTYTGNDEKENDEGEKEEMIKKKGITIEEEPVVIEKPEFVENFNINDEFADFDLPEVAVEYEDVMEE